RFGSFFYAKQCGNGEGLSPVGQAAPLRLWVYRAWFPKFPPGSAGFHPADRQCREGKAIRAVLPGSLFLVIFMLRWFERRIDPYPAGEPQQPPQGLLAFCLHYSHGAKRWLAAMTVLGAAIAILEISLFGFMGSIVDWLGSANRATFLAEEGWKLAGMAALLLLVIPLLQIIDAQIIHQTLLGNFPQRIRWM